jgi:hypothetical protein
MPKPKHIGARRIWDLRDRCRLCGPRAYAPAALGETGGAVEFVVPGTALRDTIERQFRRVRTGSVRELVIAWPGRPRATTPLPKAVFAGGAVHAGAFYGRGAKLAGKATLSFRTASGRLVKCAIDVGRARRGDADEVRLAAARRLEPLIAQNDMSGEAFARAYDLVSPWTSLVMVRRGVRAGEPPVLHKVQQMTPAGWAMFAGGRRLPASGAVLRSTNLFDRSALGEVRSQRLVTASNGLAQDLTHYHSDAPNASQSDARFSRREKLRGDEGGAAALAIALDKALAAGRLPQTIDELIAVGLFPKRADRLRELAPAYGEAMVVKAFVAALFASWRTGMSMASLEVARQVAGRMPPKLIRTLTSYIAVTRLRQGRNGGATPVC